MLAVLHLLGMFIVDLFKSRRRLEPENLFLRSSQSSFACAAFLAGPWYPRVAWRSWQRGGRLGASAKDFHYDNR
jgi:hypothetical protein